MRTVMQKFTLRIPNDLIITSNRTSEIWRRRKLKDYVHPAVQVLARDLEPMGKATIHVGITKRTRGAYDPANLTDTCKPGVDQLVRMGVLDEDDYHHVMGPWPYHRGVDKRLQGCTDFTFVLTPYSTIPF